MASKQTISDVPVYSGVFLSDSVGPTPQPGILPPQLSNMGFVIIRLKENCNDEVVKNALVAAENIEKPPYIDSNQLRFPQEANMNETDIDYKPNVSLYTFATRTSNLLPTNRLYLSIGFSYNLWVNKWKMKAPKGFLNFSNNYNNKYDSSQKPFHGDDGSQFYDGSQFSIPREKVDSDILIQIKSASRTLIDRVCAHILRLFHDESNKIEVRYGVCKQRNQFGFFDAASKAQFTANPTVQVGPIVRAWNTDCDDAKNKRKEYGDQYVDLGRISTILIGNEEENNNNTNIDDDDDDNKDEEEEENPMNPFINGTFSVLAEFVHDLNEFNNLPINKQETVFGRTKDNSSFVTAANDPLGGGLNLAYPQAHIVRTHIRGQKINKNKISQCPFTWLRESDNQNDQKNADNNDELIIEASKIPMQLYRQAASFETEQGLHGLHFFAYSRDCNIMDLIFQRMIGQSSTLSDLPKDVSQKKDPILYYDKENNITYYAVDDLLHYTKAIGCQYYFHPNLQELLNLSKWPKTNMPPRTVIGDDIAARKKLVSDCLKVLDIGLETKYMDDGKRDFSVPIISGIIRFLHLPPFDSDDDPLINDPFFNNPVNKEEDNDKKDDDKG